MTFGVREIAKRRCAAANAFRVEIGPRSQIFHRRLQCFLARRASMEIDHLRRRTFFRRFDLFASLLLFEQIDQCVLTSSLGMSTNGG